ncbi:MAG: MurR/RpiR family transcriptional regulator [Mesorhizobium sp.]|nr:MAG: MurR/RpiR family transcriptional regulator [Mesorhizobium sp.]
MRERSSNGATSGIHHIPTDSAMKNADRSSSLVRDAVYDLLTSGPSSQSRIAHFIAQNPELLGDISISKLARQTNSGEASIVRFCRTLGFSGFREFRMAFTGEIERDKARRLTQYLTTEDTHVRPEIANLSAALQHSVAASARLLDYAQIERLTERLQSATRVEAFGMGVSAVCAELLSHRLIWLGIPMHSTGTVNIARGLAHGLDASAFAIGISYEGMSEETVAFLKTARDRGAYTLAITTRDKSAVSEVAHEVLLLSSAGPWPEPGSARLMPSMALLSECIAECLKGHKYLKIPQSSRTKS